MSSSVRIPSWCAQPLRNLYDVLSPGWSLPGSQWMGGITAVIWGSESSFMTWLRGETYQFIQSRKVRKGINNFLLLKGIEYRYLFGFRPNSFFNEIESNIRPLLWAWTQTTAAGTNESAEYKFQSLRGERALMAPDTSRQGIPGHLIISNRVRVE